MTLIEFIAMTLADAIGDILEGWLGERGLRILVYSLLAVGGIAAIVITNWSK